MKLFYSPLTIILAKQQFHNSYTFLAMPILIFSPVQIIMTHPLESTTKSYKRCPSAQFMYNAIWKILVFLGNQPMAQHQQPPPRPFFAERPPAPPRGGGGPMRGPRPNFRGSPGGNFRGSPGGHRGGPRTPYTPRGRGVGGGNFRGGPRGPRPRW